MTAPGQLGLFPAVPAGRLVVVGCGARKLETPAPAALLYTGPLFRSWLEAALAVSTAPGDVLILSARYGFLDLDQPITPYNLRMTDPGAVTVAELADQVAARGIQRRTVLALCGRAYADKLRAVFPAVETPLAGLGLGEQRARCAQMAREGAR